ncbi:type II toxin-antitoxin system Phd/YefM family antitoxin [Xylophilus ampelinus]|uniref:Antitoxin n=1 Tax=Xylophilus ampelinus TaxID=54067 RepID=A0A318SI40_9BURK|nr:type II toxin-antitoxin system Phd/YefM family antitoxin [Xylophilus ampelinus]MCS4510052.1 type II toxin-antitoxin system Phd/YefM family antitoxin [Xylophilus ampelinus]PYE78366.1 prevent-host-death family protein [Xylophilus ampelinus]
MHILPLSEFRANASAMLDLVEQGATVRILRHGKPVADLVPPSADNAPQPRQPSWKQPFDPVRLASPAASLAGAVQAHRDGVRW